MIEDRKIAASDFVGNDVVSMPDEPSLDGWGTDAVKEGFDKSVKNVIVPRFNGLIDDLGGVDGASNVKLEDGRTVQEAATGVEGMVDTHKADTGNPHSVTKAQVGLGSVPNVETNDQTPTYTPAGAPAALTSGEKLGLVLGKIAAAVTALIGHLADMVLHVTAAERTEWNAKTAATDVLTKTNQTEYTPTANYHPSTKKYVDDSVSIVGNGDMLKTVYDTNNDGKVNIADEADALATGRTINGTSFNGSTDITTASWGTARTITLAGNAAGSVSVNGAENVTLTATVNSIEEVEY